MKTEQLTHCDNLSAVRNKEKIQKSLSTNDKRGTIFINKK